MKLVIWLVSLSVLLLSNGKCDKKKSSLAKLKGRLEIKALCMNYTIGLIEGELPDQYVADEWTDETTHKKYNRVFKLGNPCDFPASIKEGEEFYFTVDTSAPKSCTVCMAFYPTPPKSLRIKVLDQ
jgi:hypothetical protein